MEKRTLNPWTDFPHLTKLLNNIIKTQIGYLLTFHPCKEAIFYPTCTHTHTQVKRKKMNAHHIINSLQRWCKLKNRKKTAGDDTRGKIYWQRINSSHSCAAIFYSRQNNWIERDTHKMKLFFFQRDASRSKHIPWLLTRKSTARKLLLLIFHSHVSMM